MNYIPLHCHSFLNIGWELFKQQNKRCAITNEIIDLNIDGSLDRIDSSKGYVKNNVRWVKKRHK